MEQSKKGITLLVLLGFILSAAAIVAPAGASAGRDAPNFVVSITFTNAQGGNANSSLFGQLINITANVSIASGQPNATAPSVTLAVNGVQQGAIYTPTELDMGAFAENTWSWTPMAYGDYMVSATAVNGTDMANQTVTTAYFSALGSNIIITGVTVAPVAALIGVDSVRITAALANMGNMDNVANVSFMLDGTISLGYVGGLNVPAGGSADAILTTTFANMTVADGNHTVTASMTDLTASSMVSGNITLTNPAPNVMIDSLVANPTGQFEENNITFTAVLNNTGTADAVNQTVVWWDATGATPMQIGSTTNPTISKGMTLPVTFVWMAPLVEKDTNKTVEATIGTASMSVNVTIRDEVPAIVISNFIANPATFRIGDVVVFKATVMNNGSGDAIGMTVNFLDGTTVLATSDPFNLTVGSSTQKSLNVTISGTADVNHTFYVKESTMGTTMNMSVLVGHRLAPASIGIATFTVKPTKKDKQPTDSEQSYTLTVSLKNFGEVASTNCTLTMKEGKKVLQTAAININGGAYWNQTYTWKVKGGGDHTAVATLTGADTGTPSSVTAKCTLEYTPGFEVLFLVAAILVAALLVRRRKN